MAGTKRPVKDELGRNQTIFSRSSAGRAMASLSGMGRLARHGHGMEEHRGTRSPARRPALAHHGDGRKPGGHQHLAGRAAHSVEGQGVADSVLVDAPRDLQVVLQRGGVPGAELEGLARVEQRSVDQLLISQGQAGQGIDQGGAAGRLEAGSGLGVVGEVARRNRLARL